MRAVVTIISLLVIACAGAYVASRISPDAVAMSVGMLFGVLAGIPTALLMLASGRRSPAGDYRDATDDNFARRAYLLGLEDGRRQAAGNGETYNGQHFARLGRQTLIVGAAGENYDDSSDDW